MTIDALGRLLVCEHQGRRVTREDLNGIEIVASQYRGKKLNSPNDIIVASDGSLIFSDPHYGLTEGMGGPGEQEQPCRGVYRLAPGATELTLLADDFVTPNGLALSLDERTLYVDDTLGMHLRVFDVSADWKLQHGRIFFEFPQGVDAGVTDGMKLDEFGNIYCTGPYGVWVFNPAGKVLGCIHMPEVTANLNWGEDDGHTLFMTASTGIYSLRTLARGRYIGH
jgi:gluconolactonase